MRGLSMTLRRENMSPEPSVIAIAPTNACKFFAASQTPGTGEIHLLIAEHCLRLAVLEKKTELGLIGNRRPLVPIRKFDA
jgi:hypothetical protein